MPKTKNFKPFAHMSTTERATTYLFLIFYVCFANIFVEEIQLYTNSFTNTGAGLGFITVMLFVPFNLYIIARSRDSLQHFRDVLRFSLTHNLSRSLVMALLWSAPLLVIAYMSQKLGWETFFLKDCYMSPYAFIYLFSTVIQEIIFRILFWETNLDGEWIRQKVSLFFIVMLNSAIFSVIHEMWSVHAMLMAFLGNILFHLFYEHYRNILGTTLLHFILGWAFFDYIVKAL